MPAGGGCGRALVAGVVRRWWWLVLLGACWHYQYLGGAGLCCDRVYDRFGWVCVVGECCWLVVGGGLFGGFG